MPAEGAAGDGTGVNYLSGLGGGSTHGEPPVRARARRLSLPLTLALLAGVCATLVVLVSYPGEINSDSQWQLDQARALAFSSWHPPLLSYLWRYVDQVVPGPTGLLVLGQALFWPGLVSLVYFQCGSALKTAVICVLFFGNVAMLIGFSQIGKDSFSVAILMFSAGVLQYAQSRRSGIALLLVTLPLMVAIGARFCNAFVALPMTLWGVAILRDIQRSSTIQKFLRSGLGFIATSVAIFMVLVGGQAFFVSKVVRPTPAWASQGFMTFDLTAISVALNESYLPAFMDRGRGPLAVSELRDVFNPYDATSLLWVPTGKRGPGFVYDEREAHVLLGHWIAAMVSQPQAYVAHRARFFQGLLFSGSKNAWPYWLPAASKIESAGGFNARVRSALYHVAEVWRTKPLFMAWPYALFCVVIGAFALVPGPRPSRAFLALSTGAVGLMAGYFFLGPANQFRYCWWLLCVAFVLPVTLSIRPRVEWLVRRAVPRTLHRPDAQAGKEESVTQ